MTRKKKRKNTGRRKVRKAKKKEQTKSSKVEKRVRKPVERQAIILIAILVFILLGAIAFVYFYQQRNKFRYEGFLFEKSLFGELTVYNTTIVIGRPNGQSIIYQLFLRNDPRTFDIPVDIEIRLLQKAIIAFDPNISKCYESNLAAYELDSFLAALGIERKGATTSNEEAERMGYMKADCSDAIDSIMIVLEEAENNKKTEIVQDKNPQCYRIKIANCEILEAVERFIIETAKQLKR